MKKYIYGVLSFIFIAICCFFGGNFISTDFSASAEENTINIGTAQNFVTVFTTESTFNDENVVVRINGPLDFEGVNLAPIAQSKNVFKGTLDGQGNTLSNLTFSSSILYAGLVPYAQNATIQNIKIGGDVEFEFTGETVGDVYAGVLVGYGENVVIKNCELENTIIDKENNDSVSYDKVSLPVNSNINFGFLAGKLKGNPNALNQTMPANIVDCVNYYDAEIIVNKYTSMAIGGLVGALENCYMLDNMNYGDITYSKNASLNSTNVNTQYFGGLAGTVSGSGLNMRNNIFGGQVKSFEDVVGLNAKVGSIFGGAVSTSVKTANINFDYFIVA